MYWLQLMDKYAANWSVLIIAIGECILIAWIYGAEKFCGDIQRMIGKQSKLWVFFWSAMWRLVTPAALVVNNNYISFYLTHLTITRTVYGLSCQKKL